VHAGGIGPAEALTVRTDLRVAWRVFPEVDPDLPAALLPADWPRVRARRVFIEIYDLLGPLAELRFRQILAATDPALAELTSHFTSASVAELHAHITDTAHGDTPFERATAARLLEASRNGKGGRRH
jgi:phenylacetic acid degradation operon negative regulatory protein